MAHGGRVDAECCQRPLRHPPDGAGTGHRKQREETLQHPEAVAKGPSWRPVRQRTRVAERVPGEGVSQYECTALVEGVPDYARGLLDPQALRRTAALQVPAVRPAQAGVAHELGLAGEGDA